MSGNGADLESLVGMVRGLVDAQGAMREEMRAGFARLDGRMDRLDERMERLEGRMDRLDGRMDRLDGRMDRLEGEVAGLRQAVTEYHSAVLGHGILISELESRVRRLEQHLNLPPAA